ncbi:MAG: glycoside hydrolase family 88 protein [Paludibacter sp.]
MSNKYKLIQILFVLITFQVSGQKNTGILWLKTAITRSEEQLLAASKAYKDSKMSPRTFEKYKIVLVGPKDWTSGFFPGSLWYLYELCKNPQLRAEAQHYTELLAPAQYRKDTHDLGFILYCSYGNGYRITQNESYKHILIRGANSLITRFHIETGLIKSWDGQRNWQYPVIIDNMMNLEFLYDIGELSGNEKFKIAAVSHADKTLANHFRTDNSCFHVVNYDSIKGNVINKVTHQGFSDSSSWARGQAWALYGFTMMYRETKNSRYLAQAQKVATFILNHPRLPKDKIPYWDFDAPNIPLEPRDASAAAVIASALIELSTFSASNQMYLNAAETILKNLSSEKYLAKKGESGLFILKHSTGNWPKKSEIDTPLAYADYYFLEALSRYMKVKKISL